MCVGHRILYAGTILSTENKRQVSIYRPHGTTKIVALFRGREGV